MDDAHFDRLARAWSAAGTRRGLFGLLVALPGLGGLAESVIAGDVRNAAGRRKRRKKRHKHGKGRHRKHKKRPCRPDSRAKTCAGKCGAVKNNCRKTVDCGPCACEPACPACQVCDEITGTCLPDPTQDGEACGPGQFCRADGDCTCDADSCAACSTCQEDGVCSAPCDGAGCCADGDCLPGVTIAACGIDGESCRVCGEDELCWNGRCVCGDVCADGCQFQSIQAAVDAAEPGATIRLCRETYSSNISILKDLTLVGVSDEEDGTVLDGQDRGTVVYTGYGLTVTLEGLRITRGTQSMAGKDGAGINSTATVLKVTDCTITGNSAADAGGGIYLTGGPAIFTRCQITDNAAGFDGGGIFSAGDLTLHDCVVSGNTAGDDGAAIYNRGFLTIINSEVTDNVAEMEGGGISTAGIATLTDSRVTNNRAATGGGIFHVDGTLSLTTSQVSENTADEGGGIYNDEATVTLTDSTVEDNTPDNCAGTSVPGCSG